MEQLKQDASFFEPSDSFRDEQKVLSSLQLPQAQVPDVKKSSVGRFLLSSPTASCDEDLLMMEPLPCDSFVPNDGASIVDFQDDIISILGSSSDNIHPPPSFSSDDTALFNLCFNNVQYSNTAA